MEPIGLTPEQEREAYTLANLFVSGDGAKAYAFAAELVALRAVAEIAATIEPLHKRMEYPMGIVKSKPEEFCPRMREEKCLECDRMDRLRAALKAAGREG